MSKLLPYETIVKAHEGDPDAIDTVLSHYAGYIRYCSKVHGKVNNCRAVQVSFRPISKERTPAAISDFPHQIYNSSIPKSSRA